MGVHVILDIVPQRIDPVRWGEVFDELRALLAGDHARLLGYDWSNAAGVPLPVYTRSVERDADEPSAHRLCVAGDRATLAVGEQQTIHRDLDRYLGRCAAAVTPPADILLAAAGVLVDDGEGPPSLQSATEAPESRRALPAHPVPTGPRRRAAGHVRDGVVQVLGDAPCAAGCALPLLGAAMLVEARFPRHALVHGDIDREQADAARRWAERALGKPIALPVRVDAWRLVERLGARFGDTALVRAVQRLHLATPAKKAASLLAIFARAEAEPWWLGELGEASLADDDARAGALLGAYLESTRDLPRLCGLACLDGRGPRWKPERLVAQLAALRPAPDDASLEQALRIVFGAGAARLAAVYRTRSPNVAAPEIAAVRASQDDGGDEIDRLATLASPADLSAAQREHVHAVALLAREMGQRLEARTIEGGPEPAGLRRTIAALLARGGPTLTEDAWEWILREDDLALLRFLVALATIAPAGAAARVRRALFENRTLCRHAAAASRDDALMSAVASARPRH
jgi:hypothetical protein